MGVEIGGKDDDKVSGETQVHLFLFYASCCSRFLSSLAVPLGFRGIRKLEQAVGKSSSCQREIRRMGGVRVGNAVAAAAQGAG